MNVLLLIPLLLSLEGVRSAQNTFSDEGVVLENLSKYSKLYVSYQNCAWSSYDNGNNDNGQNACGVQAGEDETSWYRGLTECFRANVAYSLYGVEKGQEDKGCGKASYINSFFTTKGIDSFVDYMTTAGSIFSAAEEGANEISSACTVDQNENGENNENNNNANNNYNANNVKTNAYATSYGAGCSESDKSFVIKNYAGAYCDERAATGVKDTLSTFNSEIDKVQCVVIYDASASAASQNGQAAEGEDEAVEQEQQENGDSAVELLQYSRACDIDLFPEKCPDPYGLLKSNSRSNAHALAVRQHRGRAITKAIFSWFFLSIGVMLIVGSVVAYARKMQAKSEAKSTKKSKRNLNLFTRSKSQDGVEDSNTSPGSRRGFFARVKSMFSRNNK